MGRVAGFATLAALAVACAALPARADTAAGLLAFAGGRFGEAQHEWRGAARAGDGAAALYLGVQYDVGAGVAADPAQALEWYSAAAALGNVPAMFNVAVLYDSGRTVPRDPARAVRFYEQAARHDYPRAEFNLGLLFEEGDGVERDRTAARRWFERAYRHGVRAALPRLVSLGGSVPGAPPRTALAAAPTPADGSMRAFQQAQAALLGRTEAERRKAVELFRAAADDNPLAAYDLAYCYENGIGTPPDLADAFRWYRRAARLARDDELRGLAGRAAGLVAARLPPATRAMLAQTANP